MLQRRRASSSKVNLGNSIQGNNVLAIALTLGTLNISAFSLCWWYNRMVIQTTSTKNMISLRCILRCMTSKVTLFQMKSLPFDLKTVNFDSEIDDEL